MRSGTAVGKGAEQKHGDAHIALVGSHKLVRAAIERQVFLTNAMHRSGLLCVLIE